MTGLLPFTAWGQELVPVGEELRIDPAAAGVRGSPAAAALADGDFMVVWESAAPAGIRGRRLAADGSLRGEELRVDAYVGGLPRAPAVASAGPGGEVVVAWESEGSPGTDASRTSIQARRFRFDGEPAGPQLQVNAYVTGRQEGPAVAMDADGDFVVVWASVGSYDDDRSAASIQAQRFRADGGRRGSQFQVNTTTEGAQVRPAVAMDSGGGFVVVWESASIRGRRFGSDGAALGDDFPVSLGGDAPFSSRVATGPGGEFVVVWQNTDFGIFGARYHSILARSFRSSGEPHERPIRLHEDFSTTFVPDLSPDVKMPVDGEFVVSWGESYDRSISVSRFTTAGLPLGSATAGATPGAAEAALAAGSGGELLVVWSQTVDSDAEIRGRRLRFQVPDRMCHASAETLCLHDGRFTVEVVWRDFRGASGAGRVVSHRSDDSGLFWFFGADNWELLVKVLDGCSINGHYWVFAAATTNVGYTLRVTDEARGAVREYVNSLGESAPALTDTGAFATCP